MKTIMYISLFLCVFTIQPLLSQTVFENQTLTLYSDNEYLQNVDWIFRNNGHLVMQPNSELTQTPGVQIFIESNGSMSAHQATINALDPGFGTNNWGMQSFPDGQIKI